MGDRKRQRQEQEEVRKEMGLRPGDRGHDDQEAVRPRMARELGESRHDAELHAQVSESGVVLSLSQTNLSLRLNK